MLAGGLVQADGGGFNVTDRCEIYDPAINLWTATGSLNLPRYFHSAVLLAEGRVLAAGPDKSAEIYHPATGTWTLTQNMLTARRRPFDPVLLSGGNVLAAGGDNQSAAHCELTIPHWGNGRSPAI